MSWTEEAKEEIRSEQQKLKNMSSIDLVMKAMAAILQDQYRTADRSPGWPPLRDRALQYELEERAMIR